MGNEFCVGEICHVNQCLEHSSIAKYCWEKTNFATGVDARCAHRKKTFYSVAFNVYHLAVYFLRSPDFETAEGVTGLHCHWSIRTSRVNNESIIVNWKKVKRVRRFFHSPSANWFNFWSLVIWFFSVSSFFCLVPSFSLWTLTILMI